MSKLRSTCLKTIFDKTILVWKNCSKSEPNDDICCARILITLKTITSWKEIKLVFRNSWWRITVCVKIGIKSRQKKWTVAFQLVPQRTVLPLIPAANMLCTSSFPIGWTIWRPVVVLESICSTRLINNFLSCLMDGNSHSSSSLPSSLSALLFTLLLDNYSKSNLPSSFRSCGEIIPSATSFISSLFLDKFWTPIPQNFPEQANFISGPQFNFNSFASQGWTLPEKLTQIKQIQRFYEMIANFSGQNEFISGKVLVFHTKIQITGFPTKWQNSKKTLNTRVYWETPCDITCCSSCSARSQNWPSTNSARY